MPAFEWGKYLLVVIAIGCMGAGLMYGHDALSGMFNSLVAEGLISPIGVKAQTVMYWAITLYAPINLFFWSLHCVMVANARTEPLGGYITSNPMGHIMLFATLIACAFANFATCVILDPFMGTMEGLGDGMLYNALSSMGVVDHIQTIFSAAHVITALAAGIMYLYMIGLSVSIEQMQYPVRSM
jgi:hypothetical protein